MLKLAEVSVYAPVIHQVVGDLLQRIETLRLRSQDHTTVPDLAAELYKFGFEGVISLVHSVFFYAFNLFRNTHTHTQWGWKPESATVSSLGKVPCSGTQRQEMASRIPRIPPALCSHC